MKHAPAMRSLRLVVAVVVVLVLVAFAIGCSSTEAPPAFTTPHTSRAATATDDDTKSESTKSPSGGYQPSSHVPTDTSGVTPTVPAAQGVTAWHGHVESTPMVDFGGGQWCNYHVALDDIDLHVTVDANGHITSSDVGNTMTETATACDAQPLGTQKHAYAFRPADAQTPASASVLQVADPSNLPQAEVRLTIEPIDQGHMKARLFFHRTDAVDPVLNWTDTLDLDLAPISGE